jgi:NADH-quinone oxidoreductase subunit N
METPKLDVLPLTPELVLAGTGILVLLAEVLGKHVRRSSLLLLTLAGLAASAALSVALWRWEGEPTALAGMIATDRFGVIARLPILGVTAIGAVLAWHHFERSPDQHRGEIYGLLLFAASGMTLIAVSADLIMVFLALEILSLSLYVLTGISSRPASGEAAMKYFLLGAFSSAFFLYGLAMAYGAVGSTKVGELARALSGPTGTPALALVGVGFLAVGFGFKVSAAPFHMWTPDVYQGAPMPVTAFMSAGTKVAAFAALIRVLDVAFQPLSWDWTPMVWGLAAVSVVVGSVLAIAQTDLRRMLAYSSVAHAGFVLTGLTAANQDGIRSTLLYLIVYAATVVGAFGVVMLVAGRGEDRSSLEDYAGLAHRSPALAALMSLFLLSLAGIPPTGGFVAKVAVFGAAVREGHWPLVLIGVVGSVVAAFFYIRVIVQMYMREPDGELVTDGALLPTLAVGVAGLVTLALGVVPGALVDLLDQAAVLRW